MDPIIIALSGRKSAGKNETSRYICSIVDSSTTKVKEYSFADTLKEFCIETLGLTREQCYGTDEQKNSPTEYKWEGIDEFIRWRFAGMRFKRSDGLVDVIECSNYAESKKVFYDEKYSLSPRTPILNTGYITGREVMQVFGTDMIRNMFGNVWAASTVRRIKADGCDIAVITDTRFPNEVEHVIREQNGFVVRLTRNPYPDDSHPSECSLDNYSWSRDKCYIIDNKDMTVSQQNFVMSQVLETIKERSIRASIR